MRILKLLLFLFLSSLGHGQTYHTGLSFEGEEEYNRLPRVSFYQGTKFDELPLAVDLEMYCPFPGKQGDTNSCVGYAIGYGAMTIEAAIQHQWTDKDVIQENAHSALYIYNQLNNQN